MPGNTPQITLEENRMLSRFAGAPPATSASASHQMTITRFKTSTFSGLSTLLLAVLVACAAPHVRAQTIDLGAASTFAVLASTTVTTSGASSVVGDLGVSPSGTIIGFSGGDVDGVIHLNTGTSYDARQDAYTAFNQLAALAFDQDLSSTDLGDRTLNAGVYSYSSAADFNGMLTLDAQGNEGALFVFQIGTTLTTANASFNFVNGASADNVWFQVGSSTTLGANTAFAGTLIADVSQTLATGVTVNGRVIALTGAITMDASQITLTSIPEPASAALLVSAAAMMLVASRRRENRQAA